METKPAAKWARWLHDGNFAQLRQALHTEDVDGRSPLEQRAVSGLLTIASQGLCKNYRKALRFLLVEAKLDPNLVLDGGETVLSWIATRLDVHQLKIALDAGALPNQVVQTEDGRESSMALHRACQGALSKDRAVFVEILCRHGASVNARAMTKYSLRMRAARQPMGVLLDQELDENYSRTRQPVEKEWFLATIDVLLQHGADCAEISPEVLYKLLARKTVPVSVAQQMVLAKATAARICGGDIWEAVMQHAAERKDLSVVMDVLSVVNKEDRIWLDGFWARNTAPESCWPADVCEGDRQSSIVDIPALAVMKGSRDEVETLLSTGMPITETDARRGGPSRTAEHDDPPSFAVRLSRPTDGVRCSQVASCVASS